MGHSGHAQQMMVMMVVVLLVHRGGGKCAALMTVTAPAGCKSKLGAEIIWRNVSREVEHVKVEGNVAPLI